MPGIPTTSRSSANPLGSRSTPLPLQRLRARVGYVRTRSPGAPGGDDGFTLIEAIVSFTLFAIVAVSATAATINAINASHRSQQRVDAANIAQKYVSNFDMATVRNGTRSFTDSVRDEQFTVQRTVAFVGAAATCAPAASFTVHVKVFQLQSARFLARTDSVIACQTG